MIIFDLDNNIDRVFDDFIKDLNVVNDRAKRVRFPTLDVHENENDVSFIQSHRGPFRRGHTSIHDQLDCQFQRGLA